MPIRSIAKNVPKQNDKSNASNNGGSYERQ